MESVFLVTAVVGAVELLKRLQAQDYWAGLTIVVAAAIGVAAGVWGWGGVPDGETGLILGLGASGLVTVGQKISQRSSNGE